jgi:DNA polymerase-1
MDITLTRKNLLGAVIQESDKEADRAKKIMQTSFTEMEPGQAFSDAQLAYAASDVSGSMILRLAAWQMGRLMGQDHNSIHDPGSMNITDPIICAEYEALFPRNLSLWDTASLEFTFLEVVIDLELKGIKFCPERHRTVMSKIEDDYEEYRSDFLEHMSDGVEQVTLFGTAAINPDSPLQVAQSLREVGIEVENTGADKLEEALRKLEEGTKHYDILSSLTGYRKSAKLISTYGTKLLLKLHDMTGRLHYSVKQILDTGRISTANPNLQNIPASIAWRLTGDKATDEKILKRKGIRECFIPEEGHHFLIYDYSSQEMRIAAHVSQDPGLLLAFKEGRDLHSHSASLMYKRDYDELNKWAKAETEEDKINEKTGELEALGRKSLGITLEQHKEAKKQRSGGKTLNFASLYGSGAANISEKLHISKEEAQKLLDMYWEAYPKLKEFIDRAGNFAVRRGYNNTVLGRRRYYTDLLDKIKYLNACTTPKELEGKLLAYKMTWALEEPITDKNFKKTKGKVSNYLEGDIKRKAGNLTIQGTAADATKLAAINLRRDLLDKKLDAWIVGLVHDELIVECNDDYLDEVSELVEKHMIDAQVHFCPTVPILADGGPELSWKK